MHSSEQTERLSAYVDDQLDADERLRVEQWLAESEEARQLLDEFRAMGESIRALPKISLGDAFTDEVLEQAQEAKVVACAPAAAPPFDALRREPRDWRRGLIWSAAAIAAAVVVMVLTPKDDPHEIANLDTPRDKSTTILADREETHSRTPTMEAETGKSRKAELLQETNAPSDSALAKRDEMLDDSGAGLRQQEDRRKFAAGRALGDGAGVKRRSPRSPASAPSVSASIKSPSLARAPAERNDGKDKADTNQNRLAKARAIKGLAADKEARAFRSKKDPVITLRSKAPLHAPQRELIDQILGQDVAELAKLSRDRIAFGQGPADQDDDQATEGGEAQTPTKKADGGEGYRRRSKATPREVRYAIEGTPEQLAALFNRLQAIDTTLQWVSVTTDGERLSDRPDTLTVKDDIQRTFPDLAGDTLADFDGTPAAAEGKGGIDTLKAPRGVLEAPVEDEDVVASRATRSGGGGATTQSKVESIGALLRRNLEQASDSGRQNEATANRTAQARSQPENGNAKGVESAAVQIYRIVVVVQFDKATAPEASESKSGTSISDEPAPPTTKQPNN